MIGRHAVRGMRLGRLLVVTGLLEIVAVALVLTAGMRRDVPIACRVIEQARKQASLKLDAVVYNLFNLCSDLISAKHYRRLRQRAFGSWKRAAAE